MIIIFGSIVFVFWVINVQRKIKNFSSEKSFNEMNFPELKKRLDILPKLKDPTEEIKKDLDSIKELQEKAK